MNITAPNNTDRQHCGGKIDKSKTVTGDFNMHLLKRIDPENKIKF